MLRVMQIFTTTRLIASNDAEEGTRCVSKQQEKTPQGNFIKNLSKEENHFAQDG